MNLNDAKPWRNEDTLPVGTITSADQTGSAIEVLTEPFGVTVEIEGGWPGNDGLISLTKDQAKELRKLLKKAIDA